MADGKWITELTPSTPLADAARRALSLRLQVVHDAIPPALRTAEEDPEHIHQLRVATRRAGAALEIFASCLPKKEFKSAKKHLRRLRRAAGAARDGDVFLAALGNGDDWAERRRPALDILIGQVLAQRAAAQEALDEACSNYPFDFERLMAETVAGVRRPDTTPALQTLGDLAPRLLGGLVRELHRAATGDLSDYGHLHQVRIIGKRLRYAMEVVADCYAPAFREELYPRVEEMQEILGRANDSHVATLRLEGLRAQVKKLRPRDWKRFRPGVEALLRQHRDRVPRERETFLQWWARWEAEGGEAAFQSLLKEPEAQKSA